MTTAEIRRTFDALRAGLTPLIRESPRPRRTTRGSAPRSRSERQVAFNRG
jgi:hypothetical protein